MSILPRYDAQLWKIRWLKVLAVLLLVAVVLGIVVWEKLFHKYPQQLPADVEHAQFKYGSIGVEEAEGIPYWIWVVLPRVFPEYLPGPGGYASLGILWEPGQEMPIGFSKRRIGYDRVGVNCAACHTGSYRVSGDDDRLAVTQIVVGGPAIRFDPQGYVNFLAACARDPRFNAETLMSSIEYNTRLSWLDRLLYRYALIPGTQKALRRQAEENHWMRSRPAWGRGRIDPFNPVKFGMLGMDSTHDATVGNSDMMPVWELSKRKASDGYHLHWDGLSTDLEHCSFAGALGDGATRKTLPVERIRGLIQEMESFAVPQVPLRFRADLVDRGQAVFAEHCAACHAKNGSKTNSVIPWGETETLDRIATDFNRLAMWNTTDEEGRSPYQIYNDFANGYDWDLNSFVPTNGFVSVPLNGLALRGPYLHNGSVPTLADLLNPPMSSTMVRSLIDEGRPGTFARLVKLLATIDSSLPMARSEQFEIWDEWKPLVDAWCAAARAQKLRPPIFYRGSDRLDLDRVGFDASSAGTPPRSSSLPYATFILGNGNSGHLYGTTLSDEDKHALIEYLKRPTPP